jgi:hypothetical protein
MRFLILSTLVFCAMTPIISQDIFVYNTMNHPLVLPPFPAVGLDDNASGVMEVNIKFSKGRVISASVGKADIVSSSDFTNKYKLLFEKWKRDLIEVVSQWQTYAINEFAVNISIEYKLDGSLKSNERAYKVEYDPTRDVPTRIIIIGPAGTGSDRRKNQ